MSSRRFSSIGLEHIVIKGNNDLPIFLDSEDKVYFLSLFMKKKQDSTIFISYCLMSNHIHLIIEEKNPHQVSKLMENVLKAYTYWFNEKYGRLNSLFKKRFFNEPIEDEIQLLCTIRYVHNNPVAAGISNTPEEYMWSSYGEYSGQNEKKRISVEYAYEKCNITMEEILSRDMRYYWDDSKNESYTNSYEYIEASIKVFFDKNDLRCSIYDIKKLPKETQASLIEYLKYKKKCKQKNIIKVTGMSEKYIYKLFRSKLENVLKNCLFELIIFFAFF